ncbi:MAG: class I SAM-dependent methyltransferase [Bacteroidetes bacterium]|nr:class I SAM-dependent methyltransferase [Bacteroidota bacterium]
MDKEILENHKKYSERTALFKSYGYDVEKERSFIVEQAKPLNGRILEAGTGKGHFAIALAKEGRPFVTIDISAEEQHYAKLNLAYFGFNKLADFRIENAERMNFPDGSFDIIFSVNVVHHLQEPNKVTDEFIRILSPDGKIVIADFTENGFRIIEKIHALDGHTHQAGKIGLAEIEAYLNKKGFSVINAESDIQHVIVARRGII